MTYIPWSCIWKFCFTVSVSAMPLTIDWSGVWIHVGAHVVSFDPSYMSSCVFEYENKRALDGDFDSVEYPFQQMVKDPGKYCRIHFIFHLMLCSSQVSNGNPGNHVMSHWQRIYRSLKLSRKLLRHI